LPQIEKAKYYEDKAASVGKAGISSDDPEAIDKLQEKLAKLQTWQETMKAANKIIKSKKLTDEQKVEQLAPLGISSTAAYKLFQPDFCGRVGFPDYETTNNNANMRRIKERIEHLETETKRQDALGEVKEQHGDITYQESDRVELIFPGKPSDAIRSLLKTYGFKWSPTRTAWVRSLNATSRSYAKHIIEKIEKGEV
jgi:prefoldin subunit 5